MFNFEVYIKMLQTFKHITFTLLLLFWGLIAFGQNVSFTAATSHTNLKTGDRFQIEFRSNGEMRNFRPPNNLSNFRVLSGPNQSSNMSWVNGKTTSSITYSYILMAVKEGSFKLNPASANINGKSYETNSLEITVGKGVPVQQPNSNGGSNNKQVNVSDDIFIKASVNKSKVYLGEQLIATYKIYTRLNIAGGEAGDDTKLNGFWKQEIDLGQLQWNTEVIGGYQWKVATIKKYVLFPQRSGDLVVDPLAMNFIVQKRAKGGNTLMDQFFGRVENVEYNCKSKPIKIKVLPHPQPEPEGYSGAVGKLNMSVDVSATEVKANDAINIKVKVSGKGNIGLIDNLPIEFPSDFEIYDPKINDNIKTTINGVNGSREFDYLVIPRHPGKFDLGVLEFSYFDPSAKKFKTITSDPILINVLKSDGSANDNVTYSSANKEDIKILGEDIRFIHTTPLQTVKSSNTFYGSVLFYILLISAPILLIIVAIFRNKLRAANRDIVGMKKKKANKIASKLLVSAKKSLAAQNKNAFYEDISKALFGYIGNKLNIAPSELNQNNIKEQLSAIQVSENTISSLIETIELCDMARFAPVSVSDQEVYGKAENIINKIEEEVRL